MAKTVTKILMFNLLIVKCQTLSNEQMGEELYRRTSLRNARLDILKLRDSLPSDANKVNVFNLFSSLITHSLLEPLLHWSSGYSTNILDIRVFFRVKPRLILNYILQRSVAKPSRSPTS